MFDILAQRSGLPPYVNDMLSLLGLDEAALIRSLRYCRSGTELPLDLRLHQHHPSRSGPDRRSPCRASAIGRPCCGATCCSRSAWAAPRSPPRRSRPPRITRQAIAGLRRGRWRCRSRRSFPMAMPAPAPSTRPSRTWRTGSACSSAMAASRASGSCRRRTSPSPGRPAWRSTTRRSTRWAGSSRRRRAATSSGTMAARPPSAPMSASSSDRQVGVVVLTNEANVGFPDAVGAWVMDRLLGNAEVDHVAERLKLAKAGAEKDAKLWARPADATAGSRRSRRSPAASRIRRSARST